MPHAAAWPAGLTSEPPDREVLLLGTGDVPLGPGARIRARLGQLAQRGPGARPGRDTGQAGVRGIARGRLGEEDQADGVDPYPDRLLVLAAQQLLPVRVEQTRGLRGVDRAGGQVAREHLGALGVGAGLVEDAQGRAAGCGSGHRVLAVLRRVEDGRLAELVQVVVLNAVPLLAPEDIEPAVMGEVLVARAAHTTSALLDVTGLGVDDVQLLVVRDLQQLPAAAEVGRAGLTGERCRPVEVLRRGRVKGDGVDLVAVGVLRVAQLPFLFAAGAVESAGGLVVRADEYQHVADRDEAVLAVYVTAPTGLAGRRVEHVHPPRVA